MFREQKRIAATIGVEMGARRSSLIYLERLRLIHAVITAALIAGVVGWGILLWQQRAGDGRRPGADHRAVASASCTARAISRWRWSI